MSVENLTCPSCGGPITWTSQQRDTECAFCGVALDLQRSICPACRTLNPAGERFCTQCGAAIMRTCPICKHDNWGGAEYCAECGRTLDLVEIITQTRTRDTRSRLQAQQREAILIKQREAAESEARMEQFRAMERERLAEIARRTAAQNQRERQMLAGILIATAIFIIILIVASITWNWF